MFKVVQFKVGDPLQMIFRSRLFLHENHFLSKFASRLDFWISLFQNFRLYSGTTFARWLWDSIGAGRKETLPNLAKFLQPSESKNAHFSFGRGDDLLGHLDRRPPLGEALETLESVVYENPVLVRLASVVI